MARDDAALQLWSQFPVDAEPRPLVLTGLPVRLIGRFRSNHAKLAFHNGAIEAAVEMPPGLFDVMCPVPRRQDGPHRLQAIGVRQVTAGFETDRGQREFPAWEVALSDTDGPVLVLDPQVVASAWHPAGLDVGDGIGHMRHGALHEDGYTVTLIFVGIPRAYADYPRVEVLESETAAMMLPVSVGREGSESRRLYGETRQVTATLRQPLGARVLVTPSGWPVSVVPLEGAESRLPDGA